MRRRIKFAGCLSIIYVGLTVHRGKVLNYFVMDLDYSDQCKVKVSMIKYLACVLQELPEHLGMTAVTPAAGHLFKVHNDREKQYMIKYQAQNFHHIVSQLFFISVRTRQDIQTLVAFLTTCVKKSDNDG